MHTTIDYSKIANFEERKKKAFADIKEYLGEDKFNEQNELAVAMADAGRITRQYFINALAVGGITGYPAKVWANAVFGTDPRDIPALYEMFESVNQDIAVTNSILNMAGATDDQELVLPFSEVEAYADQIFAIFEDMGVTQDEAKQLATQLAAYAQDKLVAKSPDPK